MLFQASSSFPRFQAPAFVSSSRLTPAFACVQPVSRFRSPQALGLVFPRLVLFPTARPPLISKLPAYASLPGLSPVRASLGDSFGRFLPTHLRASRPPALPSSPAFLPSDLVLFRSRSAMHLSGISASLAAFLSPGLQLHPGLPKLHPTTLLSVPLSLPLLTALFHA